MKSYFGSIEIGEIKNKQTTSSKKMEAGAAFIAMNESNIRFVHYPDCQQLIIWLTHPGSEYENVRLINIKHKKIVEEMPVADRLSGSIQIVWDTLNIAPGKYTIEIDWENGWQHCIDITKFKKGFVLKVDQPIVTESNNKSSQPIQYRDGFGNILENEDLLLREKLNKELVKKFSRRIEFEGNFRSGTIIYIDNEIRIEFYHEMGGDNCILTYQQKKSGKQKPKQPYHQGKKYYNL